MKILRFISLFSLGLGIFILVQVVMPLISYTFWEYSLSKNNLALINPYSHSQMVLGTSIDDQNSTLSTVKYNFKERETIAGFQEFYLSIPKINLLSSPVAVDSEDFDTQLAHFPGTDLPGEKGNVFITGHSSEDFKLFNKTEAIFQKLISVQKGDEIIVEVEGQEFIYEVIDLKIVNPEDTWIMNPPDDSGRYLTLMTCVPPGLYYKRLVVLGELK